MPVVFADGTTLMPDQQTTDCLQIVCLPFLVFAGGADCDALCRTDCLQIACHLNNHCHR